jgi:hypothetical protein
MGALVLLIILVKYVHIRRELLSWNVQYGQHTSDGASLSTTTNNDRISVGITSERRKNIYDQWLVVRFTITFFMLSIFELFLVTYQLGSAKNSSPEAIGDHPNLTAERAKGDFILFLPGCCPSLLLFLVFGTTTPFREYMRKKFLPRRWQHREKDSTTSVALTPLDFSTEDTSDFRKSVAPSIASDGMPMSPTVDRPVMLRDFIQTGQPRKDVESGQWSSRPTTTWPVATPIMRIQP